MNNFSEHHLLMHVLNRQNYEYLPSNKTPSLYLTIKVLCWILHIHNFSPTWIKFYMLQGFYCNWFTYYVAFNFLKLNWLWPPEDGDITPKCAGALKLYLCSYCSLINDNINIIISVYFINPTPRSFRYDAIPRAIICFFNQWQRISLFIVRISCVTDGHSLQIQTAVYKSVYTPFSNTRRKNNASYFCEHTREPDSWWSRDLWFRFPVNHVFYI